VSDADNVEIQAGDALILVVDDNPDNLYIIRELVTDVLPNVNVMVTTQPRKGLRMAAEFQPDGIILDLKMPDLDGIQFCKQLKANEKTAAIPIIIITSQNTTPALRAEAMESGADDFIARPINNMELAARINVMLRIKMAEDKLRILNQELEARVRQTTGALMESEIKFRSLAEQSLTGIAIVQAEKIVYANAALAALADSTPEALLGMSPKEFLHFVAEEQREEAEANFKLFLTAEDLPPQSYDIPLRTVQGRLKWATVHAGRILLNQVPSIFLSAINITDRKAAEDSIKKSLEEKDVLLKEIHHRVKNNMAVISSLLKQQSVLFEDPAVLDAFGECILRIRSMALIHEKLYEAREFSHIDFSYYIPDLVRQVFACYKTAHQRITLNVDAQAVHMGIDQAIPCGLILNEMVTNALKYAFPGDREGVIDICFRADGNNMVLTFVDNGVGLPEEANGKEITSFGLYLIEILTEQLSGKLEVSRRDGTSFCLTFPFNDL